MLTSHNNNADLRALSLLHQCTASQTALHFHHFLFRTMTKPQLKGLNPKDEAWNSDPLLVPRIITIQHPHLHRPQLHFPTARRLQQRSSGKQCFNNADACFSDISESQHILRRSQGYNGNDLELIRQALTGLNCRISHNSCSGFLILCDTQTRYSPKSDANGAMEHSFFFFMGASIVNSTCRMSCLL